MAVTRDQQALTEVQQELARQAFRLELMLEGTSDQEVLDMIEPMAEQLRDYASDPEGLVMQLAEQNEDDE